MNSILRHVFSYATAVAMAGLLAACGGGGGAPGSTAGTGTGTGTGSSTTATLTVTLVNAAGASTNTLSGGQTGILKAVFVNNGGAPIANGIVTFTASDATLVTFNPASASALTDSQGVASIAISSKDLTTAGALTISATATSGTKTATATLPMAIGSASLTVGTLSFSPPLSGSLPAFSTGQLQIPLTISGQPASVASGLTMTSLCVGDGTATLVAGAITNGVMAATYTNKGCLRGTDTITVSFGNSSQSISVAVDAANIGSIQFVSTDIGATSLVLRGSGGLGRKESAMVTFKVVDQNNVGLAGVTVAFRATTNTGGLTVLPASATTDASGNVSTTVSSGTIPTPVRVIADATRNGKSISGLSDALTISTGLPIQKSMSMSADKYNIEGLSYDGEVAAITILMADQYGNPVSDGTTVNFIAEGGAVGSVALGAGSCNTTGNTGGCSVQLKSQAFRPANGRVTVLAYAQGLEDFVDSNGDGQYTCFDAGINPATYRPLVDKCTNGEPFTDLGDPFLDTGKLGRTSGASGAGWLDGSYDPANGDLPIPFGGTTYKANGDGKWGVNYIRRAQEFIFSGSYARLVRQDCVGGVCSDSATQTLLVNGLTGAGCSTQILSFRLTDENNNPLPAGTTVAAVDTDKLTPQTFFPAVVPSTNNIGGTAHQVTIKPDTACAAGSFAIKVTTPKGVVSQFPVKAN